MCIVDNVRPRFKKFEFSNGRYPVQEESIDQIFWGGHPFSNEGSVLRNPTMIAPWYFSRTVKRWKSRWGAFHQRDPCLGAASTPQIGDPWRRCKRWTVAWYISYVKRSVPDGKNWAMSWDGSFWNLKAWDIHWIVQVSRLDCYGRYFGCVMALWCSHKNQCARRTARRKRQIVSQLSFGFLTCSKGLKQMGCDFCCRVQAGNWSDADPLRRAVVHHRVARRGAPVALHSHVANARIRSSARQEWRDWWRTSWQSWAAHESLEVGGHLDDGPQIQSECGRVHAGAATGQAGWSRREGRKRLVMGLVIADATWIIYCSLWSPTVEQFEDTLTQASVGFGDEEFVKVSLSYMDVVVVTKTPKPVVKLQGTRQTSVKVRGKGPCRVALDPAYIIKSSSLSRTWGSQRFKRHCRGFSPPLTIQLKPELGQRCGHACSQAMTIAVCESWCTVAWPRTQTWKLASVWQSSTRRAKKDCSQIRPGSAGYTMTLGCSFMARHWGAQAPATSGRLARWPTMSSCLHLGENGRSRLAMHQLAGRVNRILAC